MGKSFTFSWPKFLFYALFGLIPLFLWVAGTGKQINFSDAYFTLTTLGKIGGIVGLCFFAANLILSGRYHFLDRIFGGLDRVFLFHRRTGKDAFFLLTLHAVLFLIRPALFSFDAFLSMVWDTTPSLLFGKLAYLGMLVIIVITIFWSGKILYERMKLLHSTLGIFLFIGGLHAYMIPSDIANNLWLRYYSLAIVSVALASYLWRTVLRRWLLLRKNYLVISVNDLGGNVTEVVMKAEKEFISTFTPGQFIFIKFKQEGFPYEDHPFSLTSSPEEASRSILRISAKALGDFTKRLIELRPGALAEIQGPYGGFSFLRAERKKQLWIAGGIGVTPFISMGRTIGEGISDAFGAPAAAYDIALYHSVKTADELVYKNDFEKIEKDVEQKHGEHGRFTFVPWIVDQKGLLNADTLREVKDLSERDVFICGPQPMMKALKTQLMAMGVPASRIHYELFKLL